MLPNKMVITGKPVFVSSLETSLCHWMFPNAYAHMSTDLQCPPVAVGSQALLSCYLNFNRTVFALNYLQTQQIVLGSRGSLLYLPAFVYCSELNERSLWGYWKGFYWHGWALNQIHTTAGISSRQMIALPSPVVCIPQRRAAHVLPVRLRASSGVCVWVGACCWCGWWREECLWWRQ